MKKDRKRFSFTVFFSIIIFFSLVAVAIFIKKDTLCNESENVSASSYWDGSVASAFSSGIGTESNPYKVTSASEFALMMNTCDTTNKYFDIETDIYLNNGYYEYDSDKYLYHVQDNNYYINNSNGKYYSDESFTEEVSNLNIITPLEDGRCIINGNNHQIFGLYNNNGNGFANHFSGTLKNLLFTNSLVVGSTTANMILDFRMGGVIDTVTFDSILSGNIASPINNAIYANINKLRVNGSIYGTNVASGIIKNATNIFLSNIEVSANLHSQNNASGFVNTMNLSAASSINNAFYNGNVSSPNFNAFVTEFNNVINDNYLNFIENSFVLGTYNVTNSYISANSNSYDDINQFFVNCYQNIDNSASESTDVLYATNEDILDTEVYLNLGFDEEIWQLDNGVFPKLKLFSDDRHSNAKLSVTSLYDNGTGIANGTKEFTFANNTITNNSIYPLEKATINIKSNGSIPLSYIGYYLSNEELSFDEIPYNYYTESITIDDNFDGYIYVKTIDAMNNINYIVSDKVYVNIANYTLKNINNNDIKAQTAINYYDKAIYCFTSENRQTGSSYDFTLLLSNVPIGTIINLEYNGEYYKYEIESDISSVSISSFKKMGGPTEALFNNFNPNNRDFTFIFDYSGVSSNVMKMVTVSFVSSINNIKRNYITTPTYILFTMNYSINLSTTTSLVNVALNSRNPITFNASIPNINNSLLDYGYYYLKLNLKNPGNTPIFEGSLNGIAFEYNNELYYPSSDGSVTIPITSKQTSIPIYLIANNKSNSSPGIYSFDAQLVVTNGKTQINSSTLNILVNLEYFDSSELSSILNITIDNEYRVITKGENNLSIPVINSANFEDSNLIYFDLPLVVSLYKKNSSGETYNLVDLAQYVANNFTQYNQNQEYFFASMRNQNYPSIELKTDLISSGAYKWVFNYYYRDSSIKTIEIPFIVK